MYTYIYYSGSWVRPRGLPGGAARTAMGHRRRRGAWGRPNRNGPPPPPPPPWGLGPSAEGPGGRGGGGINWVGIYIGKKKRKNRRQSPNILNKAPTKAY